MKKIIFGLVLLSMFSLSACGNNEKKETSSSSKVEQLESSSSSDKEKVVANANDIVNIFKEKSLPVYDEFQTSESSLDDLNNGIDSQTSFYFEKQNDSNESDLTKIIIVAICKDKSSRDEYVKNLETSNKNSEGKSISFKYAINDGINGIMSLGSAISEEDFNQYKEVFESIN